MWLASFYTMKVNNRKPGEDKIEVKKYIHKDMYKAPKDNSLFNLQIESELYRSNRLSTVSVEII